MPAGNPPGRATQLGSRAILDSLQAFSEVATGLAAESGVEAICNQVVAVLKARLGLKSCSIMLLADDDRSTLVNVAGTSPRKAGAARPAEHRRFRVGEGVAGAVVAGGQAILVPDTARDPRFQGGAAPVVRSLLCLPINAGGASIGVLNLSHAEPGFFHDDHRTVFAILATILGKLVAEARLRNDLARFNQELERQVAARTHEIQASHAYLEQILGQASDIILTVDWRGRITFANRRVADLGHDAAAVQGLPFSMLCTDGALPAPLMDAMAGRVARNVALTLRGQGVHRLDTLCSFSPMEDAGGGQGALVLVRDVTGIRQLEAQVRRMDKLTAIGTLVSGIAHEINNKLVPILVYSELLQRSQLSENDLRLIQTVHKSATGARHIMDSLLRFSRQEPPKNRVCSLNQVVRDVAGMVQFRGKRQDITLSCELADALPDVYMDEHQIGQVVLNLLNNAYDALEGAGGRIIVRTGLAGAAVRLTVADDGPGIPPELTQRIFDPFFTTKEVGKGTGLGLSLCYGIVQEHQGDIQVFSGPNGTRFEVTLPLRAAAADAGSAAAGPDRPARRGRLLVAADDPVLLEVLEHVLGEHHRVARAVSGQMVIDHLAAHATDAVVLDLNLPDVDGAAVLDWLAANRPELVGRVLFLSGAPEDAGRVLANRVPPERVIPKPFRVAEVRAAVDALLAAGAARP